jgi:tRNA nucleotidyltransferase (CCA-adding enzyme)
MRALEKEGWLKVLHPHWTMAKIDSGDLGQLVKTRQMMNELGYSIETGPIVMYFLTSRMSDKDTAEIQRMIPRRDFVDKWKRLESSAHELTKKLSGKEAAVPSGAWKILTQARPENILFLSLTVRQQAVDQKLKNFFGKWRQVKEKLPFPEMAELRITAQLPEYSEITEKAFLLLMDGRLRSHSEIMNFLKPYEPPPPPPPPAPKRGRGKATAAAGSAEAVVPGKRGRKPKAVAIPAPVPAPEVPAQPPAQQAKPSAIKAATKQAAPPPAIAKAAVTKKTAAPAKPPTKKPAPSKVGAKKQAKPPVKKAVAKKAAPAKKAPPKKAPAKKPAGKKPVAKKPARKR